mgnify:CR=1 FL=1
MQLFDIEADPRHNHLPYDGTVQYYGKVIQEMVADDYFEKLMQNIAWKNDQAIIFGRQITTKRKVAWYGEENFEYTYSNSTIKALKWTPELLELKKSKDTLERLELKGLRDVKLGTNGKKKKETVAVVDPEY